jgi:hypothetical protein
MSGSMKDGPLQEDIDDDCVANEGNTGGVTEKNLLRPNSEAGRFGCRGGRQIRAGLRRWRG